MPARAATLRCGPQHCCLQPLAATLTPGLWPTSDLLWPCECMLIPSQPPLGRSLFSPYALRATATDCELHTPATTGTLPLPIPPAVRAGSPDSAPAKRSSARPSSVVAAAPDLPHSR